MAPSRALKADSNDPFRKEAVFFSAYFIIYIAYLFITQENEILHWLSLVIIPILLLYANRRRSSASKLSFRNTLLTVGISRSNTKNGILLAIILGFAFSVLQLILSEKKLEIWNQVSSGKILIAFPLAFIFMLVTAGFTEEFFFRGVLQTRMVKALNSKFLGVVAASIMFAVYHLPYAYLNPDWPSHGNLIAALGAALSEALLLGFVLGWLYEKSDNNLLACIVMHSLVNTLPAVAMLKM